jgi:hypothetical protein
MTYGKSAGSFYLAIGRYANFIDFVPAPPSMLAVSDPSEPL